MLVFLLRSNRRIAFILRRLFKEIISLTTCSFTNLFDLSIFYTADELAYRNVCLRVFSHHLKLKTIILKLLVERDIFAFNSMIRRILRELTVEVSSKRVL